MQKSEAVTQPGAADRRTGISHEISTKLVRLCKEQYGIGPSEARTYYVDDLLVCILRGGFSQVEENLRLAGRGQAVLDQRAQWQSMMREQFVDLVETETGRRVMGFMSGNQQDPDLTAEIFLLEPEPNA